MLRKDMAVGAVPGQVGGRRRRKPHSRMSTIFVLGKRLAAGASLAAALFGLGAPRAAQAQDVRQIQDADLQIQLPYQISAVLSGAGPSSWSDEIKITAIYGTAPRFVPGGYYLVMGTYRLGSCPQASLALNLTSAYPLGVPTRTYPGQHMKVRAGSGVFALWTRMNTPGRLHVSFYPLPGGSSFNSVYMDMPSELASWFRRRW